MTPTQRHSVAIASVHTCPLEIMLARPMFPSVTAKREAPHMPNMATIEAKAYVPSRDFDLSKRFYQDLGFNLVWSTDALAYFRHGKSSFLLQNYFNPAHSRGFMMHLLVEDVEAWWSHVKAVDLASKYGVKVEPPEDRSWGLRDFVVIDPTGVLWRVGQNI